MIKIRVSFDGIQRGLRPRHEMHELQHAAAALRSFLPGVTPDTPPFSEELHADEPAFAIVTIPVSISAEDVDVIVRRYRADCSARGFEIRLQLA